MEIINLNLIPGKAWPVAHATQFDKGREFRANLFEGSQVYTLAGDETVDAIIKKPDGNQVIETLVNTADNYVIVTTTEQMTAVAGPSLGEIRITKDDTVIGSLKFILECEQSADTGIASHSEINNLETQVAAIVADQYDAGDVVFDNTPTAGHGVGFAVTSEGVLNAIPDELNDLDDVNISGAAQGEALVWNGAEWVNGTVSTVGSIDDLNDVDTTGKANADSLRYNATAQEWEAKPTTVELTLAEYEALGGDYSGYENTNIIITDAPNLNATAQDISYDGGADTVYNKVDRILHPVKIWSGSKYTLNDYIDIPDFDKNTAYMFEFMAFSGTYHTCFVSPVGDGYLQFVIWGDSTQHCRYRVQINTNSGRLTIVDVMNGGANQALVAIYAII